MSGILYLSVAGSGKTHKIIEEVLKALPEKSLIITYTLANLEQIKNKIKKKKVVIPNNIVVMSWYSFLLHECIRPYQSEDYPEIIQRIVFSQQTKKKDKTNKIKAVQSIQNKQEIQDTKASQLAIKFDDKSKGKVIERLSNIYKNIFIDEIQDMVGYDLNLIERLINSNIKVLMVGDTRQHTYSTHYPEKQYNLVEFFQEKCQHGDFTIDTSLTKTYRLNKKICDFVNKILPNEKYKITPHINVTKPEIHTTNENEGVFYIDEADVDKYLEKFSNVTQLRYNTNTKVNKKYPCYNFGESKGLEFDRVLIYPTKDMLKYLYDNQIQLKPTTEAKLYVAITRAKHSVVFINKSKHQKLDLPKVIL